jgi:hypothetical protein
VLLVLAFVVVFLAVPLTGGRLSRLTDLRLRGTWIVFASLAVAIAVTTLYPDGSRRLHVALNLATYVGGLTALWLNRRLPGLWLITAGTVANVVAISLNGGSMPASASALRAAGLPVAPGGFVSSTTVAAAKVPWLGDVFASPRAMPFHNVFSIGDILILAGATILVLVTTGSRLAWWSVGLEDADCGRVAGPSVRRLPELEPVALRVDSPTKATDAVERLRRVVDGRAGRS